MSQVLAHRRQLVAALPFRIERAEQPPPRRFRFRIFHQREGFAAREFEQFAIAQRIGYVQAERAVLARAEKFAGAAQLQIHLGDGEAVVGRDHGFEALRGILARRFSAR